VKIYRPPNQKSWLRQWLSCLSVRTQISKRLELSTPNYRPTVENYDVVCGVEHEVKMMSDRLIGVSLHVDTAAHFLVVYVSASISTPLTQNALLSWQLTTVVETNI